MLLLFCTTVGCFSRAHQISKENNNLNTNWHGFFHNSAPNVPFFLVMNWLKKVIDFQPCEESLEISHFRLESSGKTTGNYRVVSIASSSTMSWKQATVTASIQQCCVGKFLCFFLRFARLARLSELLPPCLVVAHHQARWNRWPMDWADPRFAPGLSSDIFHQFFGVFFGHALKLPGKLLVQATFSFPDHTVGVPGRGSIFSQNLPPQNWGTPTWGANLGAITTTSQAPAKTTADAEIMPPLPIRIQYTKIAVTNRVASPNIWAWGFWTLQTRISPKINQYSSSLWSQIWWINVRGTKGCKTPICPTLLTT